MLPGLLKNKVYVGLSAGSMVTGKDLSLIQSQILYGEDDKEACTLPNDQFQSALTTFLLWMDLMQVIPDKVLFPGPPAQVDEIALFA